MKKMFVYCGLAGLSLGIAACTSNRQHASLPPIGPAPAVARAPEGWLVVYSALEPQQLTGESEVIPRHSGYEIYSAGGKHLRYVNNYMLGPDRVSLPPGNYIVVASATGYSKVTAPVVIKDGKTTDVHLDGSAPPIGREAPVSDVVRLPDGTIVGWRAE